MRWLKLAPVLEHFGRTHCGLQSTAVTVQAVESIRKPIKNLRKNDSIAHAVAQRKAGREPHVGIRGLGVEFGVAEAEGTRAIVGDSHSHPVRTIHECMCLDVSIPLPREND
jgi:hypothetical protein